jgi:2-beta-glucuronyltransferase
MKEHFEALGAPIIYLPHGVDTAAFDKYYPTPFQTAGNAVSVGSMLFDRSVIDALAEAFPDIRFHLIGCNASGVFRDNVEIYNEMPFNQTLPYLQNADVGIAAYSPLADCGYLADSSMKLMQFDHLGLPSICPEFAAGDYKLRFGYQPGSPGSIAAAFGRALDASANAAPAPAQSWREVAQHFAERLFETPLRAAM